MSFTGKHRLIDEESSRIRERIIINWHGANRISYLFAARGSEIAMMTKENRRLRAATAVYSIAIGQGSSCGSVQLQLQCCSRIMTDVTWNDDHGGGKNSGAGRGAIFPPRLSTIWLRKRRVRIESRDQMLLETANATNVTSLAGGATVPSRPT